MLNPCFFIMSRFVSKVLCATGISGWLDQFGRITSQSETVVGGIFGTKINMVDYANTHQRLITPPVIKAEGENASQIEVQIRARRAVIIVVYYTKKV